MTLARSRVLLGAALALGALGARRARAADASPLVVAPIPSDIAGEAYYAAAMGFFGKRGIEPRFQPFTNGAAISAAVASGAADVGYSNVISLATAHQRGLPFTILQPANLHLESAPTAGLLAVKKGAPLARASDLTGKTVAVIGLGNIAHVAARLWIDQNGGDSTAVKFVEVPFAAMAAALEAGRVDAASMDATGDPNLGKPDDPLRVLASTFTAVAARFAPSVWFTTSDWVVKHPALMEAFLAAMRETATWANAHHAESAEILSRYTNESPAAIGRITRAVYGERISASLIQPNIDAAARYGIVRPFSATELIAPAALRG